MYDTLIDIMGVIIRSVDYIDANEVVQCSAWSYNASYRRNSPSRLDHLRKVRNCNNSVVIVGLMGSLFQLLKHLVSVLLYFIRHKRF